MDIKEIALKICRGMNPYSDIHEREFIYFANKLIESYKAELLKEAGERIAALEIYEHLAAEYGLSVFEDMAKLKDQLAKAEQRVAEACALQVATEIKFHWLDAARVAKEIRSGEWSKFVKEV